MKHRATRNRKSKNCKSRTAQLVLEPLEVRRVLATVTLNTDTGAAGELRTEIANATSGDTIEFNLPAGMEQISLSLGELAIDKSLDVDGANTAGSGTPVTIDAGGLSRVLNIDDGDNGSEAIVRLSDLTITGGDTTGVPVTEDGGGILNRETLTVVDSTVTGNFSADDGGGIFNTGAALTLEGSAVDDNAAEDRGGGIFAYGTVTISESTVSGNTINTTVGDALGAGMLLASGSVTSIDMSAVSNNYAMTSYYDPVTMTTLQGRGGGIYVSGFGDAVPTSLTITNSQLEQNSVVGMGGAIQAGIAVTLQVEDSSFTGNTATGDGGAIGTSSFNVASGRVTSLVRTTITGNSAGDDGGAIEAVDGVELRIIDSMILNNETADNGTIFLDHRGLPAALTIRGSTITGNSAMGDDGGGLRIGPGISASIDATTIADNYAYDRGGGILVTGYQDVDNQPIPVPSSLTITNSFVRDNRAADDGGGIHSGEATILVIDRTEITGNRAEELAGNTANTSFGGGLRVSFSNDAPSTATITNSLISGNFAEDDAAGLYSAQSFAVSLEYTIISDNIAGDDGGAMRVNSDVIISGSTIVGNQAGDNAGGVYVLGGTMQITESSISDNVALDFGGGLWLVGGSDTTIRRSTISGNEATNGGGGGMDNTAAQLLLEQSTVSGNSSGGLGGGIYFELDPEDPTVYSQTVSGSTITGNTGGSGGGIWINTNSAPTITGSILSGNTDTTGDGPDLYNYLASAEVSYGLIGDNYGSSLLESSGDGKGNIVGGPVNGNVDAMLSLLQDNGGPTLTHIPLEGSPVIDRGDPLVVGGVDQRGYERVVDGDGDTAAVVDMGSVEFGATPAILCDLNNDDACDIDDMRVLYDDIAAVTVGGPSDIDGSGLVDNDDISAWLVLAGDFNGKDYRAGDTDLDGNVNGPDFTTLAFNFGNVGLPGAYWDQGNFDGNVGGDFEVGGGDFTQLAFNFGHTSVAASSASVADNPRDVDRGTESAPEEESMRPFESSIAMAAEGDRSDVLTEVADESAVDALASEIPYFDVRVVLQDLVDDDAEESDRAFRIDQVFAENV